MGRTARIWRWPSRCSDHPHAGGENRFCQRALAGIRGPSPRGWGELHASRARETAPRTIPTRVGRTGTRRSVWARWPDHPHAGGENGSKLNTAADNIGPSPRGWGERQPGHADDRSHRTIPTRVGRTAAALYDSLKTADHPHAGGENACYAPGPRSLCGPSPRGWGELVEHAVPPVVIRTIPTRVGRTRSGRTGASNTADHPHAGGENKMNYGTKVGDYGPSPRGWGERTSNKALQ